MPAFAEMTRVLPTLSPISVISSLPTSADVVCTPTALTRRSFDAHAGQRAGIGCEQENTGAVSGGGEHHSLGESELHLAWRQIRDHRRETPDEFLRLVRRLDAREDRTVAPVADIERQSQQLVGSVDVFGVDDFRPPEIDFGEVVYRDLRRVNRGRDSRFCG